jgi:ferredoxin
MLEIYADKCLQCGGCVSLCPVEALFLSFDHLECDLGLCTLCEICVNFCPVGALDIKNEVAV